MYSFILQLDIVDVFHSVRVLPETQVEKQK